MKPSLSLLLFWAIVLSAAAQSEAARFVYEPCPPSLISPAAPPVSCGRLRVPEDRSSPDSPEISIFVARLPARAERSRDPIIYLPGGPGDSASADIDWWSNTPLRDDHDILLVDQRGSGYSRPSLNCPEFDVTDDDERLANCRRRLRSAGVKLSAYQAAAMAQDISDLITALELEDVNIYARSYGARVALLLARTLPGRIRAVVLDGAYTGGQSALEHAAASALRSMGRLFDDCRASDLCNAAYPEISRQFGRAAAGASAQPVEVAGLLPGAALRLDGEGFALLVRSMLADSDRLPYIPALLAAIAEDHPAYLAALEGAPPVQASNVPDAHSEGLYYSAFCADELALTTPDKIRASGEGLPSAYYPLVRAALELLADCESWTEAGELITVEADAPMLYLRGAYDPIAPPAGAAPHLRRIWRLDFPHLGHGALGNDACAEAVVAAFLKYPTREPGDSCLEDLRPPAFYIPKIVDARQE